MTANRFLLPGDILEHGQTVIAARHTTVRLDDRVDAVTAEVIQVVFELDGQRWTEHRPPEGQADIVDVAADLRSRHMAVR